MNDLTRQQRRILNALTEHVKTNGYPPSIRELGDAAGLTSTSSVTHQLRALERLGYIRRDRDKPRAIQILKASPDEVTEEAS